MSKTIKQKCINTLIFMLFCIALFSGSTVILCEEMTAENLLKTFFEQYELYLYVVTSVSVCIFFMTEGMEEKSSYRIPAAVIILLLAVLVSYQIYRLPILTETVEVEVVDLPDRNNGEAVSVKLLGYTNLDKEYKHIRFKAGQWEQENGYRYSGQPGETEKVSIQIPIGRNRILSFESEQNVGTVAVSYAGGTEKRIHLLPETGVVDVPIQPNSRWSRIVLDSGIKVLLLLPLTLLLCLVSTLGMRFCSRRLLPTVEQWKYEIAVFTLFLLHFILNSPESINGWCAAWYAMDYSMGKGSRLLPGAALRAIAGNYIDGRSAYLFISVALIILMALVAYLIGKCIRNCRPDTRNGVLFLIICYLCAPASIAYLWTAENMGRLELFVLLFALLAVLAFEKTHNLIIRYAVVAGLSVLCMAAHQGYFFTYFIIVYTVVVYDMFRNNRIQKRELLGGTAVIAVTGVSFLIFQFCTSVNFATAEELTEYLEKKTNVYIAEQALELEYFAGVKEAYYNLVTGFIKGWNLREKEFLVICLMLPIVILFAAIWNKVFKERKRRGEGLFSTSYLYILLGCLFILPDYVLNSDWSRWNSTVIGVLFFQVLYLSYRQDVIMKEVLLGLSEFVETHKVLCVAIVLYLASLAKFQGVYSMPEADRLYRIFSEGHFSYF